LVPFQLGAHVVIDDGKLGLQVCQFAAGAALKMEMWLHAPVKARLGAGAAAQFHTKPLLLENVQIAINGAEADVRELLLHSPEQFGGGGVIIAALEFLQHNSALAGVSPLAGNHGADLPWNRPG